MCLLILYTDGHGGSEVSKYLKNNFPQILNNVCSSSDISTSFEEEQNTHAIDILRKALVSIDKDVLTGPLKRKLYYQGSTSCMVYFDKSPQQSTVISANIGDSRAVLCRNGEAVDMTEDHKPNLDSERERGWPSFKHKYFTSLTLCICFIFLYS